MAVRPVVDINTIQNHLGGMTEILSRLMKKHLDAKIIGEKSKGFALLSGLVPLGNDYSIIVRKAEFTDLDGAPWHRQSIVPDFYVPENADPISFLIQPIPRRQMSKL